jgi:outer membrane protein assembly factor BamB
MHQDPTSLSDYVALNSCQDLPPVSVVTIGAPVGAHQMHYVVVGWGQVGVDPNDHVAPVGEPPTLYIAASDRLYAVHASDGTVRWCQQVKPTQELIKKWSARHGMRHGPPPSLTFGAPRVADGVVYVCVSGYGGYTCAFNAGDGALRWCTPTDAWSVAMPFGDYAVPLVREGIVYNGTYALNEQDGSVLWRIAVDTRWLSPQALVDGTLYAITQMGIHAVNARTCEVRWHYGTHMSPGGPLVVANQLLYIGTGGSVDHPEKSRCYALDADTGTLRWEYPLGNGYVGAVIDNESIYVSSRDQHLYALEKHTGGLRWKYQFAYPTYRTATIAGNVVYINIHGAYALSSTDGTLLWHKDLESGSGFYCTPSVIVDGVVYLVSGTRGPGASLYALNASNGAEYWHKHYPYHMALLAVVTSAFSAFATGQSNGKGAS